MSRIGKSPITIPSGVTVVLDPDQRVRVQGPKGCLVQALDPAITVSLAPDRVTLSRKTDQKRHKALHGLYRALLQNMVTGVHQGFQKQLELVGVGYKASMKGNNALELSLGYAHKLFVVLPPEVIVKTDAAKSKNPVIYLESVDKQLLGQVSAKIRSLRPPEPYKGKGIRLVGETIRRKAGKTAAK